MKQFSFVDGIKFINTVKTEVKDALLEESPLQISINKIPFTTTLRTPGDDLFLARGLLYSENIFSGESKNFNYYNTSENGVDTIHLEIDGLEFEQRRQLVSISSCGLCGVETFEYPIINKVSSNTTFLSSKIVEMFTLFSKEQVLFKDTGSSHACGLFDDSFKLLSIQEDIGRHNATDKCVGELLENGTLSKAEFMLISGRISYEIVHKCFQAKIVILVAVSSPSALAVRMAEKMNITLIGFSRENRFTCYSHPERIL